MTEARIAIIGGSGLYEMDALTNVREVEIDTPFGNPSDAVILGDLEGMQVAFLARHGRGHRISPTRLPVRANIYALKTLGVERIISISSVGSQKEALKPLDFVVPDHAHRPYPSEGEYILRRRNGSPYSLRRSLLYGA